MPTIGVNISHAAGVLRGGGLVAFPTETVYGLAADANNPSAVTAVYRVKRRPTNHPLIVHVASVAAVWQWAAAVPLAAEALAERFMPGALTLLLPRVAGVPDAICGGESAIALRVPAHPLAQALLAEFGGALVAPSANRFGGISPTAAGHVMRELADETDLYILDGGDCAVGIESTIVGFVGTMPFIARPGDISADDIAAATGIAVTAPPPDIRVSGNLPRHYAPTKKTHLLDAAALADFIANTPQAGVLSQHRPVATLPTHWRQAEADPRRYAHCLYRYLRELDESPDTACIVIERPLQTADWLAINDRLVRACYVE